MGAQAHRRTAAPRRRGPGGRALLGACRRVLSGAVELALRTCLPPSPFAAPLLGRAPPSAGRFGGASRHSGPAATCCNLPACPAICLPRPPPPPARPTQRPRPSQGGEPVPAHPGVPRGPHAAPAPRLPHAPLRRAGRRGRQGKPGGGGRSLLEPPLRRPRLRWPCPAHEERPAASLHPESRPLSSSTAQCRAGRRSRHAGRPQRSQRAPALPHSPLLDLQMYSIPLRSTLLLATRPLAPLHCSLGRPPAAPRWYARLPWCWSSAWGTRWSGAPTFCRSSWACARASWASWWCATRRWAAGRAGGRAGACGVGVTAYGGQAKCMLQSTGPIHVRTLEGRG